MDWGFSEGGVEAECQWSDLRKQADDGMAARHAPQSPSTAVNSVLSASLFLVHANPMRDHDSVGHAIRAGWRDR